MCVKGKARREESLSTHYFVCVDVSEFPTFKTLHVPDFNSKGLIPDLQPLCIVLARGNLPLLLPVKLERFLLSTSYFSSLRASVVIYFPLELQTRLFSVLIRLFIIIWLLS